MAKSKGNVVTHGLSGKIGDLLVFRQLKGKTVVSKIPVTSEKPTEKQAAQRQRFQQAVLYAKTAVETDERYRTVAKKKGVMPINVAVADFFNAPDIAQIDLSDYKGHAGDLISIHVTDDFAVKSVQVEIINTSGTVIEKGDALQGPGTLWNYTVTNSVGNIKECKIVVTASDFPGNITEGEANP